MEPIVRTIYGSYLQTCLLTGRPFVLVPYSTLNEAFDVQADTLPSVGETPNVKYFSIGNGGHVTATGPGGVTAPDTLQHEPTDVSVFRPLPFVLREITNDLSTIQRAKYAMRKQETHGGKQYIAYYLKRIDYTGVVPTMNSVSVSNGVKTITPFTPNSSNLNPTPPDLSNSGVNVVDGNYVSASALLGFSLNEDDVNELLEVSTILYDDSKYAVVSEVGLVSGLDKVVESPASGGGTINFNEAIAAQTVAFVSSLFAVKFTNSTNALVLDVGATEPLIALESE